MGPRLGRISDPYVSLLVVGQGSRGRKKGKKRRSASVIDGESRASIGQAVNGAAAACFLINVPVSALTKTDGPDDGPRVHQKRLASR